MRKVRKFVFSKKVDEKAAIRVLKKTIDKYPSNPRVLKQLLDFLQLHNNDGLLEQFTLKDISRLYKKLASTNKSDIELNMDFFYFVYNVLDNEEDALKLYKDYKEKTLSSFETFENKVGESWV